jgi:hypothetical protein
MPLVIEKTPGRQSRAAVAAPSTAVRERAPGSSVTGAAGPEQCWPGTLSKERPSSLRVQLGRLCCATRRLMLEQNSRRCIPKEKLRDHGLDAFCMSLYCKIALSLLLAAFQLSATAG